VPRVASSRIPQVGVSYNSIIGNITEQKKAYIPASLSIATAKFVRLAVQRNTFVSMFSRAERARASRWFTVKHTN